MYPNGAVELYYDNSKKFQTTSTGVDILGSDTTGSNLNGDLVINKSTLASRAMLVSSSFFTFIWESFFLPLLSKRSLMV